MNTVLLETCRGFK